MLASASAIRRVARSSVPRCIACARRTLASKTIATARAGSSKPSHPPSIMQAGTVMKGLSMLKDSPDPIALPDEEYPDWVWTLTDAAKAAEKNDKQKAESSSEMKKSAEEKEGNFDLKAERRKLRSSNREAIKGKNLLKST